MRRPTGPASTTPARRHDTVAAPRNG